MIDIIFNYQNEVVLVRILGHHLQFATSSYYNSFATIEGLRLDKESTLKEFPDLEGRDDWREVAIKRFKKKIKEMKNEKEISDYTISELKKLGYIPKFRKVSGFREEKL